MDLSQLNTKTPLSDNIDRIGEFVNVRRYEALRVSARADVNFKVVLEWSPDGLEKALENTLHIPSDQWKSERFEKLMPYVRIHLINTTGKPNKVLQVMTDPIGGTQPTYQNVDLAAEDKKNKSPLRRFIDKGKSKKSTSESRSSSKEDPSRDHRMPDYIPQGTILIGAKSGKVQCLARGNPGDVLTVDKEGNICWMPLSSLTSVNSTQSSSSLSSSRTSMLQSGSFGISSSNKHKISFSSVPPDDEAPKLSGEYDLIKLGILDPTD